MTDTQAGTPGGQDYIVLARKYRSQTFAELIGQDALVRTLGNAIAAGKLHHAYVLTGIRGTGKTSTARLLAMAVNCANGPSMTWAADDPAVLAIRAGRHVDVLEFDAASNRGVGDVEKLFEGVAYAPSVGRTKVYIIDEVHMLSREAFNALLKTLEEPPPRVMFIFATTEVQKIPVTVLSRCQRFDLKRIPSETLAAHFTAILAQEKLAAEPAAVAQIARAADGSVRDGLSLLDQAIALAHGGTITGVLVEEMLGVADRAQVWRLLELLLAGDVPAVWAALDDLYAGGTDALGLLQALLEAVHVVTRVKLVPSLAQGNRLSELEKRHAVPLAAKMALPNVSRAYQVLFQGLAEVKTAERPYETLSMVAVRVAYLAPLPSLEKLAAGVVEQPAAPVLAPAAVTPARELPVVRAGMVGAEREIQHTAQVAALPTTWREVVTLVRGENKILAAELERRGHCARLAETELDLSFDKGLVPAAELVRDLRQLLQRVTGLGWQVTDVSGHVTEEARGVNLVAEAQAAHAERKELAAVDPAVAAALALFPGAELERVGDEL